MVLHNGLCKVHNFWNNSWIMDIVKCPHHWCQMMMLITRTWPSYVKSKCILCILFILCIYHIFSTLQVSGAMSDCVSIYGYPIMATGKNHSIQHTPGDVARYCDAINCSFDPPENAHKKWVEEQGVCTNQGDHVQLSMMIHSLYKEASSLLCKGVQGKLPYAYLFHIFLIFFIYCIFHNILHMIMIHYIGYSETWRWMRNRRLASCWFKDRLQCPSQGGLLVPSWPRFCSDINQQRLCWH